jgi:hypothetical protein
MFLAHLRAMLIRGFQGSNRVHSQQEQLRRGARSFRLLMLSCAVAVVVGLLLLVVAQHLPAYRVPYQRALDAFQAWCTDERRLDDVAGARYLSMFGWRYLVLNVGVGLIRRQFPWRSWGRSCAEGQAAIGAARHPLPGSS